MPQVSKGKGNRGKDGGEKSSSYIPYDPSEDGYDKDQADEIIASEKGHKRFFDELANDD